MLLDWVDSRHRTVDDYAYVYYSVISTLRSACVKQPTACYPFRNACNTTVDAQDMYSCLYTIMDLYLTA
jgi:hypothetical protein